MTLRIGLLWHAFGWPNLGVDALSRTNIAILQDAAGRLGQDVEFILLGKPGNGTCIGQGVTQGPVLRIRNLVDGKLGVYTDAVKSCDLIVDICAGDGFTSIYGNFMFALHAATKLMALHCRRPLVFSPQTIGPFDTAWTRAVAAYIINRSRITFARDGKSTQAFHNMKLTAPFEEVVDVAFRLPFEKPERHASGALKVGINVSGLLFYHGERFQLTADYPTVTRRLIQSFLDQGSEVHLVSHVLGETSSTENDDPAVEVLAKEFPKAKVAPRFRDAVEAKSFISGLDFFTGGRMHACIGAFSSGVPVAPFAYSRKFNGLFDTLGYPHYIDGRAVDTETAINQTLDAFDHRARLVAAIEPGMTEARRRLAIYEDKLVELMGEILARKEGNSTAHVRSASSAAASA